MILLGILALPANATGTRRAGVVSISSGRLNVRSGASASSVVVTSLSRGTYVTLEGKSGDWWKVAYAPGKYGYCHGKYISAQNALAMTVSTQSGSLNVRSGPGTSYSKVGSVYRGQDVLVLDSANGWSRILYNGSQIGYVSGQYLSQYYSPVSLWVRDMKQMDSRWADTVVGTSGKTMAQIGCATTAIAMLESHRTGIVRYPDEMMTLLSYTPSGSVYWPAHYTIVTDGSLSVIYERLKQGKPILFGATSPYGAQHWVVITGFTGGTSMTADKFTIRDPGTYSRTNLQQFLAVYPNFYKYFYY